MNKKIIFGLISLLTLGMIGCSDQFLEDKKNYEKFDSSLFSDSTLTNYYINSIYYNMFQSYKSPVYTMIGGYNQDRTNMTEEIGGTIVSWINPLLTYTDGANCPYGASGAYLPSSLGTSVANNPYTRIRNCNTLIAYVDSIGAKLSIGYRKRAKGQAYFFRALQYFDLFRVYGGVPITTKPEDLDLNATNTRYPRATTTQMINQIVSDLDSAAAMLPAKWWASEYGRLTGDAALAVKSRVLLTYASPLFNTDWDNASNTRWASALSATQAAVTKLTADGYGLYGSTSKDWAYMFYGFDNTFCKEAIIVQLCSSATSNAQNNSWENTIRVTSQGGGGGIPAPQEMLDLFPMADGSRPNQKIPGVATAAYTYDPTLFFMNRDPRFYRTFAFSGCKWGHSANANDTIWLYRYKTSSKTAYNANNQPKSPAIIRKMSSPNAVYGSFSYSGTDIFEYRYAELLLNLAECYAATNDIPNCLSTLVLIRKRVGIPAANNYGLGAASNYDRYAAIKACLYERQIELAYEGKRFWDAQRWMLYDGVSTASSSVNTCTKLGVTPINGTCRTGYYWQYKNTLSSLVNPIPVSTRVNTYGITGIDPDASDFSTQLTNLSKLFTDNLVRVPLDSPLDYTSSTAVKILFRPNYYVFGLYSVLINNNPWLQQTIGWTDAYGTAGDYDYTK